MSLYKQAGGILLFEARVPNPSPLSPTTHNRQECIATPEGKRPVVAAVCPRQNDTVLPLILYLMMALNTGPLSQPTPLSEPHLAGL